MNKLVSGSLAIAVSAVVGLAACNSGGGGDDGTTGGGGALSSSAAAQTAFLAVGFASGYGEESSGGVVVERARRAKGLRSATSRLNANFRSVRARSVAAAVTPMTVTDCSVSGTKTVTFADGSITTTYENCIDAVAYYFSTYTSVAATEFQNGTITVTYTDSAVTVTSGSSGTPYTDRYNAVSDNTLLEESIENTTITISGSDPVTCDVIGETPTHITMELAGTSSNKYDNEGDGTLEESNEITFTSLSLHVVSVLDLTTCEATSSTITMSGTIANDDHVDATNSASIAISDSDPLTIATTYGATSESSTISGTMTIETSCADAATITLATTSPVVTNYDDYCPNSGAMTISGDASATIVYNSDGSMDVSGTHYETCETAGICS